MGPRILFIACCLAALIDVTAFGFTSGNSALRRTFSGNTAAINSPIRVTVVFTNGETSALRGFFYTDQLPSSLSVTTLDLTLNGQSVSNFTFESGLEGDVYPGCTPRRWRLETPPGFTEANPIPARGVVRITYGVASATAGSFTLRDFTWAASFLNRTNTTFGCSEAADPQTLEFHDPHWTFHQVFGWLYNAGSGWQGSQCYGWLWFDSGGHWIWSSSLQGWLGLQPATRTLWSPQYRWLTPSASFDGSALTTSLGSIHVDNYLGVKLPEGWVVSDCFGYVWPVGDGAWFYTARYSWLGVTPDGGIWRVDPPGWLSRCK